MAQWQIQTELQLGGTMVNFTGAEVLGTFQLPSIDMITPYTDTKRKKAIKLPPSFSFISLKVTLD